MAKKLKEIWSNAPHTYKIGYWICLISSIVLISAGFILPPLAEIHNSVLVACGILFGFASLGVGIAALERGLDASVKHGETEIVITNPDNK